MKMVASKKIIIEARINEYAMRSVNKHVPWTADEIAETAARVREEGASILHYHARTPEGGAVNTVEANAEIISKVRAKSDILLLPTLGFISNDKDAKNRINTVAELAKTASTKPDIAPIDTGSANLDSWDPVSKQFSHSERVYINTTETLAHYARVLESVGVKPKLVSWSVGFTRRALNMVEAGLVKPPPYMLFHLTDGEYITGHPATEDGLAAHLKFLPRSSDIEWTVNALGGNLLKLVPMISREGGHMAIGIGDYGYPELGAPPNEAIIREAVAIAKSNGREPATPDEVREMLRLS